MAQAKFIDDDLFSWTLEQAQGLIPEIEKKALAVGGKIIADEMKKRLRGVIADKSATKLVDSFGITPVKQNTQLNWNLHLGFDGYQEPGYGKFPNGVPFQLLARTFESGAVIGGRGGRSRRTETRIGGSRRLLRLLRYGRYVKKHFMKCGIRSRRSSRRSENR